MIFETLHLLIIENNHVNVIFQTLYLLFRISWSYTVKMKRFYLFSKQVIDLAFPVTSKQFSPVSMRGGIQWVNGDPLQHRWDLFFLFLFPTLWKQTCSDGFQLTYLFLSARAGVLTCFVCPFCFCRGRIYPFLCCAASNQRKCLCIDLLRAWQRNKFRFVGPFARIQSRIQYLFLFQSFSSLCDIILFRWNGDVFVAWHAQSNESLRILRWWR